jgi:transposase-like protein
MVEKQCRTGLRRYRTRSEVQQLIAEYEASGLTLREFCRRKDVPANTLGRYLKRYGRQRVPTEGSQQWVAVEVAEPRETSGVLAVVVRGGRRIEVAGGFDTAVLERLVLALERMG